MKRRITICRKLHEVGLMTKAELKTEGDYNHRTVPHNIMRVYLLFARKAVALMDKSYILCILVNWLARKIWVTRAIHKQQEFEDMGG